MKYRGTNRFCTHIEVVKVVPQSGSNTGSIEISVTGGHGPYLFQWSNGATTQNVEGLTGGNTYSVTVTDSKGCTAVKNISICVNPPPFAYLKPATYPVGFVTPCNEGGGSIEAPAPENTGSPPYSYKWSGPNGFTAAGKKINGLIIPGNYCVTITDACGLTASYCQELKCNCSVEVKQDIDDCTSEDPGHIEVKYIYPFADHDYFIVWPDGDIAKVHVNNQNKVVSGTKKKSFPIGTTGFVCYTVVDAVWGCSFKQCVQLFQLKNAYMRVFERPYEFGYNGYSDDDQLINALNSIGLPYSVPNEYIARWGYGEPCKGENDDHSSGLLRYHPYNMSHPCTGGGIIEIGPSSNGQAIVVYPNFVGYKFQAGNKCYCLWPPGLLTFDPEFMTMADNTILSQAYPWSPYSNFIVPDNPVTPQPADPYTVPVVAWFGCNDNNYVPPGGVQPPHVGPNCDDLESPCGFGQECLFVADPATCSYDVYCEGWEVPFTIIPAYGYCIQNTGGWQNPGCEIYEYCTLNPCEERFYLGGGKNTFNDPWWSINVVVQLISENPGLEPYLGYLLEAGSPCPNGWCSCETLSQALPPCLQCLTGGTDGTENSVQTDGEGKNIQNNETGTTSIRNGLTLKTYPNPFTHNLNIEVTTTHPGRTMLRIFNIFGSELWRQEPYLETGRNLLHWAPITELAAGVYSIHIMDEDGCQSVSKVVYSTH